MNRYLAAGFGFSLLFNTFTSALADDQEVPTSQEGYDYAETLDSDLSDKLGESESGPEVHSTIDDDGNETVHLNYDVPGGGSVIHGESSDPE